MKVLEVNKPSFDLLGITRWHEAGYKGKRGKAITYERFPFSDIFKDNIVALWTDKYPIDGLTEEANMHGLFTASAFLQVAPDAKLYQIVEDNSCVNGVFSGALVDTTIPWMIANKPDVGFRSIWDIVSGFDKIYADTMGFCSLFCAAGNFDKDTYAYRINDNCWFGVGAVGYQHGYFYPEGYSSESPYVDFCGLTDINVINNGGGESLFGGTSCSAPVLAGMCHLVNDFFIDKIGRPLSHDEMAIFIVENCTDMGELGKDNATGYGMFVLPDPATIDIGRYAPLEITMQIGNKTMTVNGVEQTLDQAPIIAPTGRTLAPVRAVFEAAGLTVSWDALTKTITATR